MIPLLALCIAAFQEHPEWGPPPPVAPYGMEALPTEHVLIPLVFPVMGVCRYKDGYGDIRGNFRHTGIDIRAAKMTPIVAPFSGALGMKAMSFWIIGDDGWSMLGTHLNDDNEGRHDHRGDRDVMFAPNLFPGARVVAGQFIGYVGESGDATAPHLHFEIYAPGTGRIMGRIRNPMPSLQQARKIHEPVSTISDRVPSATVRQARFIGCVRRLRPGTGSITLLLTDVQRADRVDHVMTAIRYRSIKVSPSVVQAAGGWESLNRLSPTQRVAAYIEEPTMTASQILVIDSP